MRAQPINDWLTEHNARVLAETKAPDGILHWYSVGGKLVIVHYYTDGGWEVYTPVTNRNDVRATISGLDKYLGEIEASPGNHSSVPADEAARLLQSAK